jgi:hypothetical protein
MPSLNENESARQISPRLFACECCGFLSTLGQEFTFVEGVRVDRGCAERIAAKDPLICEWHASAKQKAGAS